MQEMFYSFNQEPVDAQWDAFTRLSLQRANVFLYKVFTKTPSFHSPWRFGCYHKIANDGTRIACCIVSRDTNFKYEAVAELEEPVEEFISDTLFTKLLLICQPD